MQLRDAAWRWSEKFVETVDRSIRDRPMDAAAMPDWPSIATGWRGGGMTQNKLARST
jgi:hypothetical protein